MKLAFTVCSNNYLAKAKVVADSFAAYHPEYKFLIFLVDRIDSTLDYTAFAGIEITEIHKVVQDVIPLALKYNIIELNTAVKPDIFIYLFGNGKVDMAVYLDPDLMVFDRFTEVEEVLLQANQNIVITPHFCSPIDDGRYPSEIDFTCLGLYNLGFIAVKNTAESNRFLEWWRQRLMKYCYIKPEQGMFTDQLWVNLAPVFFNGIYILKHRGYNVANWNLYERVMNHVNGIWFVNKSERLKFFHFSQYEFSNPYSISKFQNRHVIESRPDVKEIIDNYQQCLIINRFTDFHKSNCFYHQLHQDHTLKVRKIERSMVNRIKRRLRRYIVSVKKN